MLATENGHREIAFLLKKREAFQRGPLPVRVLGPPVRFLSSLARNSTAVLSGLALLVREPAIGAFSLVVLVLFVIGLLMMSIAPALPRLPAVFQINVSGSMCEIGLNAATQLLENGENIRFVKVCNCDSFPWENVVIAIETGGNGWFCFRIPRMEIGAEYLLAYNNFIREDGAHLHPRGHIPRIILIKADTPHGKGQWLREKTNGFVL
jgi:hypothetical protein